MRTFTISTLQPAPSMNTDEQRIEVATYAEAVKKARQSWVKTGRRTSLHSGEFALYYWHRIEASGEFKDRNTNGGVPTSGQYTR